MFTKKLLVCLCYFLYVLTSSWSLPDKSSVRVLTEEEVALLVEMGTQLSLLRKEHKIFFVDGVWQFNTLADDLNELILADIHDIEVLSKEFLSTRWSKHAQEFMSLFTPALENYFHIDVSCLSTEEEVMALWQKIHWPTTWLDISLDSYDLLLEAIERQQQWYYFLVSESTVWRGFFHKVAKDMLPSLSASLLYYWLYTVDGVWPIESRAAGVRILYTLYLGFYEALDLLISQVRSRYVVYISQLPWPKEQLDLLKRLLDNNLRLIKEMFYDVNQYKYFLKERNRFIFKNNTLVLKKYQEALMQSYLWLFAQEEEKIMVKL